MEYLKNLINNNIENFKNNVEASLYAKLDAKLNEKRVEVASEIYNEECIPCSQGMNEETEDKDCDEMYKDCMEEVKAAGGDGETHGGKERCAKKKRECENE